MDEVRAEDLVQKIGQPRKDRAVLVAGVDNLTPLGKVTPVTVDDDGNLHVRADKLEEKLEELLGERQQDPAAWSIADRLRRLEEKLALLESGQAKVTLSGRATLVAMGLNEVIPPGVEIFRPSLAEAPVVQAYRRYGFILRFVATPTENRRARVNLALRRLTPNGSKSGSTEYIMGDRVNVLVADGSPGTPQSLIMEPVHVPAEWFNFGILNTGTEDVTVNWYVVEV